MKPFPIALLALISLFYACSTPDTLRLEERATGVKVIYENSDRLTGLQTRGAAYAKATPPPLKVDIIDDFVAVTLTAKGAPIQGPDEFYGTFFDSIPAFRRGVSLWRYKPWNAWTRPLLIDNPRDLKDWDVQFFYWQYEDGVYGAAIPLSGNGYRTTLGQHEGKFGAKSQSYAPPSANQDTIPQMLIGFGADPYALFKDLFETGLEVVGKPETKIATKSFPAQMDYLGWCTWNASDNGKLLTEDFVVESVKTFTDNDFPLGWVVVDDGWFDHKNRMLNALRPDLAKFPQGFGPLNRRLKEECGVKEIGVWHSFNGYWNGINADSELGEQYAEELFSWQTKPWATGADTLKSKTYHFIRPDSKALPEFYRDLHRTFQEQGFTFLKVDNQLVTEQMAPRNYPVFTLSEKMHEALYAAADEYFAGAVINCMDMTADAYLNFGTSAVARAVEDYFPVEDNGVGYKMPYGNAAVHLTMAVYNSLYFQQMVYPDFDMFESHNPDATFHAVARALNNGPIYVTDKPGEQDFTVLRKLCYSDGRLIRPERALTPTADCLFQIQDPQAFKAYSQTGNTGLLGVWNMADAEKVSGNIAADDVYGIEGEEFIVYEHFSRRHWKVNRTERLPVELSRMETQLYYVIPVAKDAAAIGLIDKYNAPGTIAEQTISPSGMEVNLADHGTFAAILPGAPRRVLVDGTEREFTFTDGVLTVAIPPTKPRRSHAVAVRW